MTNVFRWVEARELKKDLRKYGAIMPLALKHQILFAIAAQEKREQRKILLSNVGKYVA